MTMLDSSIMHSCSALLMVVHAVCAKADLCVSMCVCKMCLCLMLVAEMRVLVRVLVLMLVPVLELELVQIRYRLVRHLRFFGARQPSKSIHNSMLARFTFAFCSWVHAPGKS